MDTSRRRKFTAEEWERFLRQRPKTVLATINADGTPHMTPVGFLYEDGAFKMTTTTDRVKYRNMARDGRISLIIRGQVNEQDGEGVVVVSGAAVVDTSGAGDAFVGALAFYLARFPWLAQAEATRRAGVIATHSVTRPGTQSSYPRRDELARSLFE